MKSTVRSVCRMLSIAAVLSALSPAALAKEKPHQAPGVHKLAMVVRLATAAETEATGESGAYGRMRAEGIPGEDIVRNGSVAMGIVYCCGGKISEKTRLMFYVPPALTLAVGDVVEVKLGRTADRKKRDPSLINRAVARHESLEDASGECRWLPENDALWMRVLYCEWMEARGWAYAGGLEPTWYLPAAAPD